MLEKFRRFELITRIWVDDFLRTSNRRIYAAGDVCLEHKFTYIAEASAQIAVRNAPFPDRQRLSALSVPWSTYTDRAIADNEEASFVKIYVRERSDRILGATIVARRAGDMIDEITLALVARAGLRTLARVIHDYPTQADAIKQAPDAYRMRLTSLLRSLQQLW